MARTIIPAAMPWKVGDATYSARRLSPIGYQELMNLVVANHPDPRVAARKAIEGLSDGLGKHVWDSMIAHAPPWPPDMDSPEAKMILLTEDGMSVIIFHSLRKSHPGFTREQARAIAQSLGMEEFQDLLEIAMGGDAEESPDGGPVPPVGPPPIPAVGPSAPTTSTSATSSA